jgi:glycerol uptake facilitator-like aquaporin
VAPLLDLALCLMDEGSPTPGAYERWGSPGWTGRSTTQSLAVELFGTFALGSGGTGAIVVNAASGGPVTHVGIALTFGLLVLAYAVSDVSGAHLNLAVTVGFAVAGRFPVRAVPPHVLAQCAGAFLASGALRVLFPDHPTLGATLPAAMPFSRSCSR